MHIEPGLVDGAKIGLSYATAAAAGATAIFYGRAALREKGPLSFALRSVMATAGVFLFFEVLPHFAVGVSEVHLILGTTLFLILGTGPAAFGLALGLLIQGLFFAPSDLPQFAMNVTTLLVPLFALHAVAKRTIAPGRAYVDLRYREVLAFSLVYQGGVVAWVAFWAFFGQGFGAENVAAVTTFGAAYLLVVLVEPLADLAVLAAAKGLRARGSLLTSPRLYGTV
jgi:ABC-type Co2+ transport system permease subunit